MFERSEYWPRDRSCEIVLGLESAEGNAPSAEDTFKMHGGKGEKGRRVEGLSDHGWALIRESKTSGMMPIVLPNNKLRETGRFAITHRMCLGNGRRKCSAEGAT